MRRESGSSGSSFSWREAASRHEETCWQVPRHRPWLCLWMSHTSSCLALVCPLVTKLLFLPPAEADLQPSCQRHLQSKTLCWDGKGKSPKLHDMKKHLKQNNFEKQNQNKPPCCVPHALRNSFQIPSAFLLLLGTYFYSLAQNFTLINTLLLLTDILCSSDLF